MRDKELAVPLHASHGFGGHLTGKRVVWLLPDGWAKGLEVVPDPFKLTIEIAFQIVHGFSGHNGSHTSWSLLRLVYSLLGESCGSPNSSRIVIIGIIDSSPQGPSYGNRL